jgi:hypothetical protein
MSSASRHALGAVAGFLLTPVIAFGLIYGVAEFLNGSRRFLTPWTGTGVLILTAVLLGVLVGSRLSPVASLISGLSFLLLNLLWVAQFLTLGGVADDLGRALPRDLYGGYLTLLGTGTFLILGVLLLVASAFPARWRGNRPVRVPPHTPHTPHTSYTSHTPPPLGTGYGGEHHGSPAYGEHYRSPAYGEQGGAETTRPLRRDGQE